MCEKCATAYVVLHTFILLMLVENFWKQKQAHNIFQFVDNNAYIGMNRCIFVEIFAFDALPLSYLIFIFEFFFSPPLLIFQIVCFIAFDSVSLWPIAILLWNINMLWGMSHICVPNKHISMRCIEGKQEYQTGTKHCIVRWNPQYRFNMHNEKKNEINV